MKKFLIALNIVIWSFVGYQAAHAAEPKKAKAAAVKKAPVAKKAPALPPTSSIRPEIKKPEKVTRKAVVKKPATKK